MSQAGWKARSFVGKRWKRYRERPTSSGEHNHVDSDRPAPLSRAEQYGLSFAIIRNLAWLSRLRIQKILVEL